MCVKIPAHILRSLAPDLRESSGHSLLTAAAIRGEVEPRLVFWVDSARVEVDGEFEDWSHLEVKFPIVLRSVDEWPFMIERDEVRKDVWGSLKGYENSIPDRLRSNCWQLRNGRLKDHSAFGIGHEDHWLYLKTAAMPFIGFDRDGRVFHHNTPDWVKRFKLREIFEDYKRLGRPVRGHGMRELERLVLPEE